MLMSWIFSSILLISIVCAAILGNGSMLSEAVLSGAQSGVKLSIAMAGSICLWSGAQRVMEKTGLMEMLAVLLRPLLRILFPESKDDAGLAGDLSANVCANLLGLGNAATPMGIRAARRLASYRNNGIAGDSLCRLIVLNSASIQLIPTSIAAVRASLGCAAPFDILPAVWITSFCSASTGLLAALLLGKVWRHD